jgi:hypothetical protein
MPTIEGASPEQRAILEKILAGIPEPRIRALRISPEYDHEPERDEQGNPLIDWDPDTPLGDGLRLVNPEWPDHRTEWELGLVGVAFHRASAEAGLTPIVVASSQQGGSYFWGDDLAASAPPLDPAAEEARIQRAAGAVGATVEGVQFLHPGGTAVAVVLRVPEPHSFLRQELRPFLDASGHHDRSRLSSHLTVRDDQADPAYQLAPGMTATRRDLGCCAPGGFSRGLFAPPPPRCPVYDRAS